MKDTNEAWCSLHRSHLHLSPECRSQQHKLSGDNRNTRDGQRDDQHQYQAGNNRATTAPRHANTAITPGSTTVVETCNMSATSTARSETTAKTTTTTTRTPPQDICYSFIATPTTSSDVTVTMTAGSGASSYFIGSQLLPGTKRIMLSYVQS